MRLNLGVWDTLKTAKKKRKKIEAIRPCGGLKQKQRAIRPLCVSSRVSKTKRDIFSHLRGM